MTDEQIIKALECCTIDGEKDCFNCAETNWTSCRTTLMKQALDLINRQKAKIDALYEIDRKSDEEIHELRTELIKRQNLEESFCKTMHKFDKRLAKTVKLERAEAIKEFAERIKDIRGRLFPYIYYDKGWNGVIDDLVKEMMESEKVKYDNNPELLKGGA